MEEAVEDFWGMFIIIGVVLLWIYSALFGWGVVNGAGFFRWLFFFYIPTVCVVSFLYAVLRELIRQGKQ